MTKNINKIRTRAGLSMVSSAAILLGTLLAHQAYAQDDTESMEDESEVTIEEVQVFGIKQSLKNAQDMKRDAATFVDVITASDITSLPDKSVVDALTRVPGVTVEVFEATDDPEHFGAEGSTALVRGLNRTLTQFNGRTSFSATKWGALNLSHIPSELVAAIEVQKNQTASMIEGGIAGTLNLITRKPFDSDGKIMGGAIKYDYTDNSEEWSPSLSGLFSNNWDTDIGKVGFLLSVAWSESNARSEAIGSHDNYERSNRNKYENVAGELIPFYDENGNPRPEGMSLDGVGTPIPGSEFNDVYWVPPSIQARAKNDFRDRVGLATSVQWSSPDETVMAAFEFIRSDGNSVWNERLIQDGDSLGFSSRGAVQKDVSTLLEIPGYSGLNESFDAKGVFTHGILSGATYAPETRYHDETTDVNDFSLDVEWKASDNLTVSGDLQYVDSSQVMFDHTIHSFFRSDVWLDVREKETPQIGFLGDNFHPLTATEAVLRNGSLLVDDDGHYWGGDTSSITDPNNITHRAAMDHNTESDGDALAFALDIDYEFEDSWVTNIKAGFRVSERDQLHKETTYAWGQIAPEFKKTRSVADYPGFQEFRPLGKDFHDGDALIEGSITSFFFPKLEWVKDLGGYQAALSDITPLDYDPSQPITDDNSDTFSIKGEDAFTTLENKVVDGKAAGSPFAPDRIFGVEERNSAAYVQLDFDFVDLPMPVRGNIGLRYVESDVTSSGHITFDKPKGKWTEPQLYDEFTEIDLPENLADFLDVMRSEYSDNGGNYDEAYKVAEKELNWLDGYTQTHGVKAEPFSTVLPSLNLTVNLREDLLLRIGASKAMYVPHLSLKRASRTLGAIIEPIDRKVTDANYVEPGTDEPETLQTVTFKGYSGESVGGSNPYLVPEKAYNTDIGLEWYFADVGSVSGVVFRKDMKEMVRKGSTRVHVENPGSEVTETVSQLDTYYNVGKAQINGIELSYQQTYDMLPGIWSGLGLQMNYTYLDTNEDVTSGVDTSIFGTFVDLPLEGLSPTSYNIIAFFESEKFSTRLAYNFRSEYMLSGRDVIGKRPVYNADRAVLDYSFTYFLNEEIKIGFDLSNLTNEQTRTSFQHNAIGDLSSRNFFVSDRRLTVRLSGSF